jgi:hypothetical protein
LKQDFFWKESRVGWVCFWSSVCIFWNLVSGEVSCFRDRACRWSWSSFFSRGEGPGKREKGGLGWVGMMSYGGVLSCPLPSAHEDVSDWSTKRRKGNKKAVSASENNLEIEIESASLLLQLQSCEALCVSNHGESGRDSVQESVGLRPLLTQPPILRTCAIVS